MSISNYVTVPKPLVANLSLGLLILSIPYKWNCGRLYVVVDFS